jgi:hypothetical protein
VDEIESGNAAPFTSEPVGGIARRRVRVLVAFATGALVVAGSIALLAGCDSGNSGNHAGAGTTDTTVGGAGRSGTRPGGSESTSTPGRGGTDTGSRSTGSGSTSRPGDSAGGSGTLPRNGSTPTTRRGPTSVTFRPTSVTLRPTGATTPPTAAPTVAPTVAAAYTAGYQAECRHIWATTADADGLLWDADWLEQGGIKVSVCYGQENPSYAAFYAAPADAQQGAVSDADSDMSDWTLGGTLINTSRTKTWTGG